MLHSLVCPGQVKQVAPYLKNGDQPPGSRSGEKGRSIPHKWRRGHDNSHGQDPGGNRSLYTSQMETQGPHRVLCMRDPGKEVAPYLTNGDHANHVVITVSIK